MKKILALTSAILIGCMAIGARSTSGRPSDLPGSAIVLIEKNFGKNKIHHVKVDKGTFGGVDYDVILTNGTELEFNSNGALTEIDCGRKAIPNDLIPQPIRDYMKRYFPKDKIVKMEIKKNLYEIELQNGAEFEFDGAGRFLRVND